MGGDFLPPRVPRLGRLRAILFDLDGTLVETGALYTASYERALGELLERPPSMQELFAMRPASEREFLLRSFGEELGGRLHDRMCDHYEALAPELLGGPYEGVEAMLEAVLGAGLRVGMVTGKGRRCLEATRRCFDLDRFEVILGEEDAPAPKPDPRGLRMALEALGVAPAEALYVGDTPMDAEAALAASMAPAVALWSRRPDRRASFVAQLLERAPGAEGALFLHAPAELAAALSG